VIWSDAGDEVLVHLDGLEVHRRDGALVVHVELEADELGRERLTLPFVFGEPRGRSLIATTSERAGSGPLAARWGAVAQDAVFAAIAAIRDERKHCVSELDALVERGKGA
jgi:hypothetical protein